MSPSILMVAAENGLIEGGKVGGVADVIAGVAPALAQQGAEVQIIMPSYGSLHLQKGFNKTTTVELEFAASQQIVDVYYNFDNVKKLTTWIIDHPIFSLCGKGNIYCNDPPDSPFAQDATKFAFFCNTVAQMLLDRQLGAITHVHLHDWQAGFLLLLKNHDLRYQSILSTYHYVYSIHNLAYQGIRPIAGHESSLRHWWPQFETVADEIIDPRWRDCINPMRIGINLADKLHTVSPGYANEILEPSNPSRGYYGGEGLENDLRRINSKAGLVGILNGCNYDVEPLKEKNSAAVYQEIIDYLQTESSVASMNKTVISRLEQWIKRSPGILCTSVGRISPQKMGLLIDDRDGKTALDQMLVKIKHSGVIVCLGSGDTDLEKQLFTIADKHANFVFINGFAKNLSDWLYACGDLFLMPSQFEPCGISQMLAMRSGQPCLVHGVGGLNDTINDGQDGFIFYGSTPQEQVKNMLSRFSQVVKLKTTKPEQWQSICSNAANARFTWTSSARKYLAELY